MADSYYTTVVRGDSPVSYWPLDDPSGATAHDAISTNHMAIGTNVLIAQTDVPGTGFASSMKFPNSGGGVNGTGVLTCNSGGVPPGSAMPATGGSNQPYSVELWFKINAGNGSLLGLFQYGTSSTNLLNTLEIFSNTTVYNSWWTNNFSFTVASLAGTGWHYEAWTFDGTNIVGYLDGVNKGGSVRSGTYIPTNNNLFIGYNAGNALTMNGWLAAPAVYNYTLTQAQITAHYAARTAVLPSGNPELTGLLLSSVIPFEPY